MFEETQPHGDNMSSEQTLEHDAAVIITTTILFLHLFVINVAWMWFHCVLLLSRARVVMTTALSEKTWRHLPWPRDRSFGKRARGAVAIDSYGLCLVARLGQIKNLRTPGADSLRCFSQQVGFNNAVVGPPCNRFSALFYVRSATKTGS